MAESQEIHQIEYRWQPAKDMSAVACSMSPESFRSWVQRIGPWVRHPGVDAPTESVRYEMYRDRAAALVWRQRDRQAVQFDDGRDGRPLVSRVLLGPADVLTPEVAVTLCYTGLPETIGPRPGTVSFGATLPPVDAAGLTELVWDNAEALDRAAAREAGLERVVAAALGDRDTPLSVQLPERFIVRPPQGGSQALLLWGLRRTMGPLLGRGGGRRSWSFSTFELPLSDMDPETLPDIVFRLAQAAPQAAPMTPRAEIRVRPQDPVPVPVDTAYQHLARLLVVAYRDLGGDELSRVIAARAGGLSSPDRRIQAVYDALDDSLPAVTVISQGTGNAPPAVPYAAPPVAAAPYRAGEESARYSGEVEQPPAPAVLDTAAPAVLETAAPELVAPAAPAERHQPEPSRLPPAAPPPPAASRPPAAPPPPAVSRPPAAPAPPAVSRPPAAPAPPAASRPPAAAQPVTTRPAPAPPSVPVTSPMAARRTVSAGRSPQDAPQLFTGESRHPQAGEAPPPTTLTALLALLSAGPASQEFESAFQALRAKNFQSGPQDRVGSRRLIRDRGWFVDVFQQYGQAEFEDILVMIFWHTVIPDLGDRHVSGELADWAGKLAAPAVVIRALYATTEGTPGMRQLMDQALRPALSWRWLNENGIPPPAVPQAPAAVSPPVRDTASGSRDAGAGAQGGPAQQAVAQPSGGPQTLQGLLDRKVTMPVPLVLAICIAVIVLLLVAPR